MACELGKAVSNIPIKRAEPIHTYSADISGMRSVQTTRHRPQNIQELYERLQYSKRMHIKKTIPQFPTSVSGLSSIITSHSLQSLPQLQELLDVAQAEMLKIGCPMAVKHNEVAPGQHEMSPVFRTANVSCDSNVCFMEVMNREAQKLGLQARD